MTRFPSFISNNISRMLLKSLSIPLYLEFQFDFLQDSARICIHYLVLPLLILALWRHMESYNMDNIAVLRELPVVWRYEVIIWTDVE